MRLLNDVLVEDANLTHHQQAHVAHDVVGQRFIGDVITGDVQPEALALNPAPLLKSISKSKHTRLSMLPSHS